MDKPVWSKQLIEYMLKVLTDQHKRFGEFDHREVAKKLNDTFAPSIPLQTQHIYDQLESLLKRFSEEKQKSSSNWDWMAPVQQLYDIVAGDERAKVVVRPNVIKPRASSTIVNNPIHQQNGADKPVLKLYPKPTTKVTSVSGSNGSSGAVVSTVIQSNKYAQPAGSKSPKKVDIKIGVQTSKASQKQQVMVSQATQQQTLLPAPAQAVALQMAPGQVQIQSGVQIQRIEPQFTRIISPYPTQQTLTTAATSKAPQTAQAQPIMLITKQKTTGEQFLIPIAPSTQPIQKFQVSSQATKLIQPITTIQTQAAKSTQPTTQQASATSKNQTQQQSQPKKPLTKPAIIQHQSKEAKQQALMKRSMAPSKTVTAAPIAVIASTSSATNEIKKDNKQEKTTKTHEGKQRIMPIPHVEYLLEVYAEYLDKRMLESGRLSKGKGV